MATASVATTLYLASLAQSSYAQQSAAPASIWWVPILAALIGVISAQLTPLIKDYFLQIKTEERVRVADQAAVFRNYAAPLVESCEKLMWRFSEIFLNSRHQFLKTTTLPLEYNEYKRTSTLYRIASLLGWLRAINLELSSLPRGGSGLTGPIQDAIHNVRSALADGPFVELHRLEQLCGLWRIEISKSDKSGLNNLAMRLELELYRSAGQELKNNTEYLFKMSEDLKYSVCTNVANLICSELSRAKLGEAVVRETLNQAIQAMSYREALVYRDWQDAIGDAMLEKDPTSVRRYRVRGYSEFDNIIKQDYVWFNVFKSSIDDIDFEEANPNDFRARQLESLAKGVAKIIVEISNGRDKDLISDEAKNKANAFIKRPC